MKRKMEEQAAEELRLLEITHPNRFSHLKTELRSFISLLRTHEGEDGETACIPGSSAINTQESSSGKPMEEESGAKESVVRRGRRKRRKKARMDRVEAALERAQVCLQKIRHLKTALLSCG